MYINTQTLVCLDSLYDLQQLFPHISFPVTGPDAGTLASLGYAEVVATDAPTITATQRLSEGTPELVDGQWWQVWTVEDMTEEEVATALTAAKEAKVKEAAAVCDAALAPYATRFGVLERETWQAQLSESAAILANPDLPASSYPAIATIIAITGESAADFAAAVQKNNEDWLLLATTAAGQRQKAVKEIKALTSVEDVRAYEIVIAV